MVDCLPATGGGLAIPVIALALGLLGAGVILVVRSGRHRHGPAVDAARRRRCSWHPSSW